MMIPTQLQRSGSSYTAQSAPKSGLQYWKTDISKQVHEVPPVLNRIRADLMGRGVVWGKAGFGSRIHHRRSQGVALAPGIPCMPLS